MTNFLIAAEAIFLTPFVGGLTFLGILAVAAVAKKERADRTRAELTAQTLEFAHDPEAQVQASRSYMQRWEDHPAYRADIAKTRRDLTRRRMTEEAWKRATGKDIA